MIFGPFRLAIRIVSLLLVAIIVYLAVSLVQVWLTSREYDPHPAAAILVMGAAEDNGIPTPDLLARLKEALMLYRNGDAHLIMVTGSREKGDVYTESGVGATYLKNNGVPAGDILQAGGANSYQNVAEAAPQLKARHALTVLVTTDPFHEHRSMAIASSLGLTPSPTPTRSSPISGWSTVPYFFTEAVGVGLGRILGYNHLEWLHAA
jgi:uncharacterized SAM-binding protein YcdF (DUF218 family)